MNVQVEILLNVDSFTNIGLHYSGIYFFKFRLYQLTTQDKGEATLDMVEPFYHFQSDFQTHEICQEDPHSLIAPCIDEEQAQFWTKAVLIRYEAEEAKLNDIVQFRPLIEVKPGYLNTEFQLECELNFCDCMALGGPTYWRKSKHLIAAGQAKFKPILTQRYRIQTGVQGVQEAVTLEFPGAFCSMLQIQVQSSMLDFKMCAQRQPLDKFFFQNVQIDPASLWGIHQSYSTVIEKMHNQLLAFVKTLKPDYQLPAPVEESKEPEHQAGGSKNEFKIDLAQFKSLKLVAEHLLNTLNQQAAKNVILQHQIVEIFKSQTPEVCEYFNGLQMASRQKKVNESVVREVIQTDNFALVVPVDRVTHHTLAQQLRLKKLSAKNLLLDGWTGEKISRIETSDKLQPIIFEDYYVLSSSYEPKIEPKYTHLIVMAHGFQGCASDMKHIKNQLCTKTGAYFMLSKANEGKGTEASIYEMGVRLSNEIKSQLESKSNVQKLSFIGFSMGGVIIRAALPFLEEYKSKFYTFLSIGSPHLGYVYNSNLMFDTGMWLVEKWSKAQSLQELALRDAPNLTDCLVYKMSESEVGLRHFCHILLVCSTQDQYVPFDSARVQMCQQALKDPLGNHYIQMTHNLLGSVKAGAVHRITVDFGIENKSVDNWIGREAHIKLLEYRPWLEMFAVRYQDYFK